MGDNIRNCVSKVQQTARRTVWISGACLCVAFVIFTLFIFALVDYWLRNYDVGIRYLLFATSGICIAAICFSVIKRVIRSRMSDLDVTRLIDERVESLDGRMSSAFSFLDQNSNAESPAFRKSIIQRVENELRSFDASTLFDFRAMRRAIFFLLLSIVSVAVISLFNASLLSTGVSRILFPWSTVEWPRVNKLQFENLPDRLAQGSPLDILVVDRNHRLPDLVTLEFVSDGTEAFQSREMNILNDSARYHFNRIQQSISVRAIAGDDKTEWRRVTVSPAPRIEKVEFSVTPPAYAQLDAQKFTDKVTAIEGSTLVASGRATEVLDSVQFNFQKSSQTSPFKANVDRKQFNLTSEANCVLDESSDLTIALQNREGITGGLLRRYRIIVKPDESPLVDVKLQNSLGSTTPNGRIEIQISVIEDVRLEKVDLFATISNPSKNVTFPIFNRQENLPEIVRKKNSIEERLELNQSIAVSDIGEVELGDMIVLSVQARDAKGNVGSSNTIVVRIETQSELIQKLLDKQNTIFNQIQKALDSQKKANQQISLIENSLVEKNQDQNLKRVNLNRLKNAQTLEQEVIRWMTGKESGVETRLVELKSQIESNSLQANDIYEQVSNLLRQVQSINETQLAAVEQEFRNVANEIQSAKEAAKVSQIQFELTQKMQDLIGLIENIDQTRSLTRQLIEIRKKQTKLENDAKQIQTATIGKSFPQLPESLQKKLSSLATLQADLVREIQDVGRKLETLSQRESNDSRKSEKLLQALRIYEQAKLAKKMNSAAGNFRENQIGLALSASGEIVSAIDRMLKILQGNFNADTQQKLADSKNQKEKIDDLMNRQSTIVDALFGQLDSLEFAKLESEQSAIADELSAMADQAKRTQQDAKDLLSAAQKAASRTASSLREEDEAKSKTAAQDVLSQLEALKKALEDQIEKQQRRLEQQQEDKAAEVLQTVARQLARERKRLSPLFEDMAPADEPIYRESSRKLDVLREQLSTVVPSFKDEIAMEWLLKKVIQQLSDAAAELRGSQPPKAEPYMDDALESLQSILKAIKNQKEQQSSKQNPLEKNQQQGGGQKRGIDAVAVKLLIERQNSILEETQKIQSQIDSGVAIDEKRLERIQKEESELLKIVLAYIEKLESANKQPEPKKKVEEIPDLPDF